MPGDFFYVVIIPTPSNDPITWDDGSTITWDDGSPITWD